MLDRVKDLEEVADDLGFVLGEAPEVERSLLEFAREVRLGREYPEVLEPPVLLVLEVPEIVVGKGPSTVPECRYVRFDGFQFEGPAAVFQRGDCGEVVAAFS